MVLFRKYSKLSFLCGVMEQFKSNFILLEQCLKRFFYQSNFFCCFLSFLKSWLFEMPSFQNPELHLGTDLIFFFFTTGSKEQPVISASCYYYCCLSLFDNQISVCILLLLTEPGMLLLGRRSTLAAEAVVIRCLLGWNLPDWASVTFLACSFFPNNAAGWCYFCSEYWSILFTNSQSNSVSKAFSSCCIWNYLGMDWGWSVAKIQAWRAECGSPSPAWHIKAFFNCYF